MLFLLAILCLSGCSSVKEDKKTELYVYAATSMTETLTELSTIYETQNPDIKLIFNFDSSGTLKKQIEEGATCDVFISASQTPMNQLDITCTADNKDGLDFVLKDSRFDILENKVVLVVPDDNPSNINSFEDMTACLKSGNILMSIGNRDVPVGEYTLSIFDYYDIIEEELNDIGCLTYGINVKEVVTQVSSNVADCGIVYQTDAYSSKLKIVDTATVDMCGQVIYPACVIKTSDNVTKANEFIDFLRSADASIVFERFGFTPLF